MTWAGTCTQSSHPEEPHSCWFSKYSTGARLLKALGQRNRQMFQK